MLYHIFISDQECQIFDELSRFPNVLILIDNICVTSWWFLPNETFDVSLLLYSKRQNVWLLTVLMTVINNHHAEHQRQLTSPLRKDETRAHLFLRRSAMILAVSLNKTDLPSLIRLGIRTSSIIKSLMMFDFCWLDRQTTSNNRCLQTYSNTDPSNNPMKPSTSTEIRVVVIKDGSLVEDHRI